MLLKASEYFSYYQYGVVCPSGVEKSIHSLRSCIDDHWLDEDFTVAKVDLRNAFNLVALNAVLEKCAEFFHGRSGIMEYIQNCGIPWACSALLLVSNRAIHLDHSYFHLCCFN